jgi:ABC-2 type transport system permease protein
MIIGMFFAASAIARVRDDEAGGYLDNFLVQPYSRVRWLSGRAGYTATVVLITGILSGIVTWLAILSQHAGISWHTLWLAGLNAIIPVLFIVGVGVCAMGILPRLTSVITYGAIGWSFLVVMLSSGLNLNHWLLDSSILHQVAFAPALPPEWSTNGVILLITVGLVIIGLISFHRRDIQNE